MMCEMNGEIAPRLSGKNFFGKFSILRIESWHENCFIIPVKSSYVATKIVSECAWCLPKSCTVCRSRVFKRLGVDISHGICYYHLSEMKQQLLRAKQNER